MKDIYKINLDASSKSADKARAEQILSTLGTSVRDLDSLISQIPTVIRRSLPESANVVLPSVSSYLYHKKKAVYCKVIARNHGHGKSPLGRIVFTAQVSPQFKLCSIEASNLTNYQLFQCNGKASLTDRDLEQARCHEQREFETLKAAELKSLEHMSDQNFSYVFSATQVLLEKEQIDAALAVEIFEAAVALAFHEDSLDEEIHSTYQALAFHLENLCLAKPALQALADLMLRISMATVPANIVDAAKNIALQLERVSEMEKASGKLVLLRVTQLSKEKSANQQALLGILTAVSNSLNNDSVNVESFQPVRDLCNQIFSKTTLPEAIAQLQFAQVQHEVKKHITRLSDEPLEKKVKRLLEEAIQFSSASPTKLDILTDFLLFARDFAGGKFDEAAYSRRLELYQDQRLGQLLKSVYTEYHFCLARATAGTEANSVVNIILQELQHMPESMCDEAKAFLTKQQGQKFLETAKSLCAVLQGHPVADLPTGLSEEFFASFHSTHSRMALDKTAKDARAALTTFQIETKSLQENSSERKKRSKIFSELEVLLAEEKGELVLIIFSLFEHAKELPSDLKQSAEYRLAERLVALQQSYPNLAGWGLNATRAFIREEMTLTQYLEIAKKIKKASKASENILALFAATKTLHNQLAEFRIDVEKNKEALGVFRHFVLLAITAEFETSEWEKEGRLILVMLPILMATENLPDPEKLKKSPQYQFAAALVTLENCSSIESAHQQAVKELIAEIRKASEQASADLVMLTSVLTETYQLYSKASATPVEPDKYTKYALLAQKMHEHSWGKRAAQLMVGLIALALIATSVAMLIATFGVATPITTAGGAVLIGALFKGAASLSLGVSFASQCVSGSMLLGSLGLFGSAVASAKGYWNKHRQVADKMQVMPDSLSPPSTPAQ